MVDLNGTRIRVKSAIKRHLANRTGEEEGTDTHSLSLSLFVGIVTALRSIRVMGSYMNFKNFGGTSQLDGSGGKQGSVCPLDRQSSVYSLTFDEFQNTLGGGGKWKDLGSMNMEDLLKSIWNAEEGQGDATTNAGEEGSVPAGGGGNLQRQGSLTLPRTLSQKTVDEVWRDVMKETFGAKDGIGSGGSNLGGREPTLGEMTLEQFLVGAGVVKEDIQPAATPNGAEIYSGLSPISADSSGLTLGFQNDGVLGNRLADHSNLGITMGGLRSSEKRSQRPQPHLQPIFPKQTTLAFSAPSQLGNNIQMTQPRTKVPVSGIVDAFSNSVVQGGAMIAGGYRNGAAVALESPRNHLRPDTLGISYNDNSSLSPSPYNFGESGRGRRSSGPVEKVVERRRKRMIKNRESAARSRARKQAYTLELEAEVAKLKEMNQELRRKQEELLQMQNNQVTETDSNPSGGKRRCLRRTLTGPW